MNRRLALSQLSVLVVASGLALGCSSEAPADPSAPSQGVGAITGASGPTDAQHHEARVRAALAKGNVGTADAAEALLARWGRAPIVEARVVVSEGAFEGRWAWSAVNDAATALRVAAFDVPINRKTSGAVVLTEVKVDGVVVAAGGTSARWEVPVDVAPQKRVTIELAFKGAVPRVSAPEAPLHGATGAAPRTVGVDGKVDLDVLLAMLGDDAGLRQLVPVVPVIDGVEAFGEHGAVTVLAGCFPVMEAGVFSLEVVAPAEVAVDATGRRVGSEVADTQTTQRFVALGAREAAVVLTRGLAASSTLEGDVMVTTRAKEVVPEAAMSQVRRALEDFQTRWGRGPEALTLIVADVQATKHGTAQSVVALPGMLIVPAQGFDAPKPSAGAAGANGGLSISNLLGDMVTHHPARREAMAFALTTALAQQWWLGLATDAATDNVLRQGFARAGALAVVASKGGDKAMRRALEFALKLPVQLALDRGERDIALAGVTSNDTLSALKAGLFADALARHLGADVLAALAAKMRGRAVDLNALRGAIEAAAPRPSETRVFLARWLDETHLAEEVGRLRPEVLLEYFVADGAIGSLKSTLMGQLGADGLGGKALTLLGQGQDLDAGFALSLLGELAGDQLDPSMKKWLTLGTGLIGGGDKRKVAIDGLVEELGAKLGIPEHDRSRLRQLSTLLMDQLGKAVTDDPSAPIPPHAPAPTPSAP